MPFIKDRPNKTFTPKKKRPWLTDASVKMGSINNYPDEDADKDDKERTKSGQRDDKGTAKSGQRDYKKTTNKPNKNQGTKEIDDKTDGNRDDIKRTNSGQTDDKGTTFDVSLLVQNEKKIFRSIFAMANMNGNRISQNITIDYLMDSTLIESKYGLKKSLERIIEKGALIRKQGKRGRGGWMTFEIPEPIFGKAFSIMDDIKRTNRRQTDDKGTAKGTAEKTTMPPSSSSLNINNEIKETTTDEWRNINMTPLEHIGFGVGQLNQIMFKNKLTAEQVQDSINYFAFDLKHNNKKCDKPPLNMFMGIVSSGGSPYLAPDNYESEMDRGMRLYDERNREIKHNRDELEKEAKKIDFDNWLDGLSKEDVEEIVGEKLNHKTGIKFWKAGLIRHHDENVWPIRKKEIL